MEKETIWDQLAAHFSGESTNSINESVHSWKEKDPINLKCYNIFETLRFKFNFSHSTEAKKEVFKIVLRKIEQNQIRIKRLKWIYAAASIAVFIALGLAITSNLQREKSEFVEITTVCPKGVKSYIRLSDGTIVYLNSGTTIKYPSKFDGDLRLLSLEGEAYFAVAKMKSKPFVVRAGGIEVKVLGTHFNIKAYESDKTVETSLEEGSVSLIKMGLLKSKIILKPGQQAIFNKENKAIKVNPIENDKVAVWKDNKFYFKSISLKQITNILENEFRVKIRIENQSINDELYTGDFTNGEGLEQILNLICKQSNLNFKNKMGTYYIQNN